MTIIARRKTEFVDTDSNMKPHWKKIKGGEHQCFVCDKKFKSHHKRTFIGVHKKTGEKLIRHQYCEPGSSNWESKFGGMISINISPKSEIKQGKKINKDSVTTIIKRRK